MNFNKKDALTNAIESIIKPTIDEEIDVKKRTVDTLAGREKTEKSDDVGPSGDFKSTKVLFHAGPKDNETETNTTTSDVNKERANKEKLRMKESLTLKAFKEKYESHSMLDQMINEVLSKDASAGDWIHDFVHSDNPKFAGKSKEQRKKMALAAYYAKQRNEEVEQVEEELKGNQHKIDKNKNNKIDAHDFKILRGEKKTVKEEEEQVEEGWDEMMKAVKDRSGPQPSGGSGIKKGSRYGGSKQKDQPEQEEDKKKVTEAKRPEDDSVPFIVGANTSSSPESPVVKQTPMSRAKNLAQLAMKNIKKELGQKGN